jgi:site-specific DNA-methyltransferase (cytosine-N4-specific)
MAELESIVAERDNGIPKDMVSPAEPTLVYQTALGRMFCGDTVNLLDGPLGQGLEGKTQLVFTSPPFPLNEKKKYGNLKGEEYIDWFSEFGPKLTKLLTADGSIVIEIGHAWEPGRPVMSTVVLKALLTFLERANLRLCQEFVWYNPARLPSPIQWVNVERIRVKDAFSKIWWMSPVDRPKADNRRVLREYSRSMKRLLETGEYNHGPRPSEHNIGKESFARNNAGAIPPNVGGADEAPSLGTLLKGTNTRSNDAYQRFCRDRDLPLHPARMPRELPEFFIKFLTEEGDLVFDPFGGSNTTGEVAEELKRRWISSEAQLEYVTASLGRFQAGQLKVVGNVAVKAPPKDTPDMFEPLP